MRLWVGLILLFVCSGPVFVLASEMPPPGFIREHSELFSWMLGLAIVVIGALLTHYVNQADKNNQQQWKKIDEHETRLTTIEAQHEVMMGVQSGHPRRRATDQQGEN